MLFITLTMPATVSSSCILDTWTPPVLSTDATSSLSDGGAR
jgi:hypothetical protein